MRILHPIYIQLIQSVWAESRVCTLPILEYSVRTGATFCSIPTAWISCTYVCIWRNILVFHFVGLSIHLLVQIAKPQGTYGNYKWPDTAEFPN